MIMLSHDRVTITMMRYFDYDDMMLLMRRMMMMMMAEIMDVKGRRRRGRRKEVVAGRIEPRGCNGWI